MVAPIRSSYRFQLHAGFTLHDAASQIPYVADLGVTTCYVSPILAARAGSTHGYDIVDHAAINPELGGEAGWRVFRDALETRGLGVILDVVANHMGVDEQANPWWRDVLEHGQCSRFAKYFDIAWQPETGPLKDKLLLPVLGDTYGAALEAGELTVVVHESWFQLDYHGRRFPLDPRSCAPLLRDGLEAPGPAEHATEDDRLELQSIATSLDHLPPHESCDPAKAALRARETQVARTRLDALVRRSPAIAAHLAASVAAHNGDGEVGRDRYLRLHRLLEAQAYRLAFWRTAAHEINYRRFFDVNELAAVRMEDQEVFDAAHATVGRLLEDPVVVGLRIDHPDGLFDPGEYFDRLRTLFAQRRPWDPDGRSAYLVIEKILAPGEELNGRWPVDGTTGYDFLRDLNGVFADHGRSADFTRVYRRFSKRPVTFDEEVSESKRLIMQTGLAGELTVLARTLSRVAQMNWRSRDFTEPLLRDLLEDFVAMLPVYRTYRTPAGESEQDVRYVLTGLNRAADRQRADDPNALLFLAEVLLGDDWRGRESANRRFPVRSDEEVTARTLFAMSLQQYTAPVQAKGVEDTSFYRYNALVSLNEVGGDPAGFGVQVPDFHAQNAARRARRPREMLATATHDTKLGEDARARINALSEVPREWAAALARWARVNSRHRTRVDEGWGPDRNDEYRFYQVALGAWPFDGDGGPADPDEAFGERLANYMLKAVKEAKRHTSWIEPNRPYDEAVGRFVRGVLRPRDAGAFRKELAPLWKRVARAGVVNTLGQVVLKVASPGVPDFYQGTEFWDWNLVDPDNRRPVDYERRRHALDRVCEDREDPRATPGATARLAHTWWDPALKMLVTTRALHARRRHGVFVDGDYVPVTAEGPRVAHLVGFSRSAGDEHLLAVCTRWSTRLSPDQPGLPCGEDVWGDAEILLAGRSGEQRWRDVLSGREVRMRDGRARLADLLGTLPVALLLSTA